MNYAAGFLLDASTTRVVLIVKARPASQRGLLNAVGGKVEPGETPLDTMVREFNEETGLVVHEWVHDTTLSGPDFKVDFFSSWGDVDRARTITDENIEVVPVEDVLLRRRPMMRNLPMLLSIALDRSGIIRPVQLRDGIPQP